MRIIFCITTAGHGKGGHFHSLHSIAEELSGQHEVMVLNIGLTQSEVLNSSLYTTQFFAYSGLNFPVVLAKLIKCAKAFKPDAIQAFDVESFAFSRILSQRFSLNSGLVKCGGPNPNRYYPVVDKLVLFSEENYRYFDSEHRYSSAQLALIPQRVPVVKLDKLRHQALLAKHSLEGLVLLRIARIGKHYYRSIVQGIHLTKRLRERGVDITFVVIGAVQSDDYLSKIREMIDQLSVQKYVVIETDEVYTRQASGLLGIADLVLGTGRNFMEACSLGKIVLVPYSEGNLPLLVSDKNFNEISKTNFSPRTKVTNYNAGVNFDSILKIAQEGATVESKNWFDSSFDVRAGAPKYISLFKLVWPRRTYLADIFVNALYSMKTFLVRR